MREKILSATSTLDHHFHRTYRPFFVSRHARAILAAIDPDSISGPCDYSSDLTNQRPTVTSKEVSYVDAALVLLSQVMYQLP
jgi:hypothetical protein